MCVTKFAKTVPQIAQELKSNLLLNIKPTLLYYPETPNTLTIDGQACFHRRLFADPVKPLRCTTGSVEPVNGNNKDVGEAMQTAASNCLNYPVDWICFCYLLKIQHCCLCPNGSYNPPPATYLPHPLSL